LQSCGKKGMSRFLVDLIKKQCLDFIGLQETTHFSGKMILCINFLGDGYPPLVNSEVFWEPLDCQGSMCVILYQV
jgi:hypothetical protein